MAPHPPLPSPGRPPASSSATTTTLTRQSLPATAPCKPPVPQWKPTPPPTACATPYPTRAPPSHSSKSIKPSGSTATAKGGSAALSTPSTVIPCTSATTAASFPLTSPAPIPTSPADHRHRPPRPPYPSPPPPPQFAHRRRPHPPPLNSPPTPASSSPVNRPRLSVPPTLGRSQGHGARRLQRYRLQDLPALRRRPRRQANLPLPVALHPQGQPRQRQAGGARPLLRRRQPRLAQEQNRRYLVRHAPTRHPRGRRRLCHPLLHPPRSDLPARLPPKRPPRRARLSLGAPRGWGTRQHRVGLPPSHVRQERLRPPLPLDTQSRFLTIPNIILSSAFDTIYLVNLPPRRHLHGLRRHAQRRRRSLPLVR